MRWTSALVSLALCISACAAQRNPDAHRNRAWRTKTTSTRSATKATSSMKTSTIKSGASAVATSQPALSTKCINHAAPGQRMVFAHYMAMVCAFRLWLSTQLIRAIGHTPDGSYTTDIRMAAKAGIHAFALNFGGWTNEFARWETVLDSIYAATEKYNALKEACPFKLFISFDMTSVKDPAMIVRLALKYQDSPAQLYIDGNKMFMSNFEDDNVNVNAFNWQTAVLDPIKKGLTDADLYFMPGSCVKDGSKLFNRSYADGIFTWLHPSTSASKEADLDVSYSNLSKSSGKAWMAGVAPWFFKHLEGYNWGNTQDAQIFVPRMQRLLTLKPRFVELLTWNDFGESSYLGQADPKQYTTIKYAQWEHSGFLEMASIFASTLMNDLTEVPTGASGFKEQVFMFYRTQPWANKGKNDPMGIPTDAKGEDSIFVVSFLSSPANVTITNGGSTTFTAAAGVHMRAVPFKVGSVAMNVQRGSTKLVSKTGPSIVSANNIYNANAVCI